MRSPRNPVQRRRVNVTMPPIAIPELWANFVRFNPIVRLPEFLLGIVLARFYGLLAGGKHFLVRRGHILYLPALIILLSLWAWGGTHIPYLLMHSGLLLPLWSCLVLGFALGGGVLAKLLSQRPLVFLGETSYCVYALHFVVIQWLVRRVGV